MTAITAQVSGVETIVMVSPRFHPATVYAGTLAGVKTFIQAGGSQSIAALAYRTSMVPKVDMVVGPGNVFVTEAKKQLQGTIGIDMLAGPSEVGIIADSDANPEWVAWDLLAQAEHDPQARAYLWTDSTELANRVIESLNKAIVSLELSAKDKNDMKTALEHSAIMVMPNLVACAEVSNTVAPEHLQLQTTEPDKLKPYLKHYGALFMGYAATAAFGDYMAGPNHTLPTGGTARFSSLLNPLSFMRAQSSMSVSNDSKSLTALASLAKNSASFAAIEGLAAHQRAAESRLPESLKE